MQLLKKTFADQLVSAVLFGSVARGTADADSDIDILVILKDLPPGRFKRQAVLESVYQRTDAMGLTGRINCHLKTPEEARKISLYYFDFPADSKILHDTNRFFADIIEEVKKIIQKNGSIRKRWGKFYYWDLRPGTNADETVEIL